MSGPTLVPPGHQAISVMRRVEGERLVLRTRRASGDCSTLVLLSPVGLQFAGTLRGVVLRGRGSIEGLPPEVSRTLEGFRVRARVAPEETGIAEVVDAGVLQVRADEGISEALPPSGYGYAWISTVWVPGDPLDKAWATLDEAGRTDALRQIAENLATLHRYGIFYGDLKPSNVIVGESGVVLIDLETLREVPGVDAPVRSLEYTPGYAAPEQEAMYEAYLTSDVWAFGALAASQWLSRPPGEAVRAVTAADPSDRVTAALPEPWLEVLRACLRPVPQARPRAAAVAAVLRGEDVGLEGFMDPPAAPGFGAYVQLTPEEGGDLTDETTRVEDPPSSSEGLEVFTPPELPPSQVATISPDQAMAFDDLLIDQADRPARRRSPALLVGGVVLLLGLLLIAGVGTRIALDRFGPTAPGTPDGPTDPVTPLREALMRHKTDAKFNGQDEIDRILAQATAAAERDPTPEVIGVRALAFVWSQRWHYSTADWDPAKWALAERETRRALAAGATVESRFARAMTMSAACRLMSERDADTRRGRCDEAEHQFDLLEEAHDTDRAGWLAVEIHWAAEVLEMHLVLRAMRVEDLVAIAEHTETAHTHCEEAWPLLDTAPVNGDEMNEDCIAISGWAEDYPAFLRWSDRLLSRRDRTSLDGAYPEVAKIFRGGALACTYRDVDRRGLPTRRARTGSWEHLCDVLGLAALGCGDAEAPTRLRRRARHVPWAAVQTALRDPPREECLLGNEESTIRERYR